MPLGVSPNMYGQLEQGGPPHCLARGCSSLYSYSQIKSPSSQSVQQDKESRGMKELAPMDHKKHSAICGVGGEGGELTVWY